MALSLRASSEPATHEQTRVYFFGSLRAECAKLLLYAFSLGAFGFLNNFDTYMFIPWEHLAYGFPFDYHGSLTLICTFPECRSYMTLSLRASSEAATHDQTRIYFFGSLRAECAELLLYVCSLGAFSFLNN